jgi:hypothetical protein
MTAIRARPKRAGAAAGTFYDGHALRQRRDYGDCNP